MDKTETVIQYLKSFPNTYAELYKFLSDLFKVEVTEQQLLKAKIGVLLTYLVPFVETKGADMLDVLFFANYQKPEYTFIQLQVHSILLIFHKLETNQHLNFIIF